MNNFIKTVLTIIGTCIVFLIAYNFTFAPEKKVVEEKVIGSVVKSNEYLGTTTDGTFATSIYKTLVSGPGSLGNINIMTVGNDSIVFYDATTSDKTLRTNQATTTLGKIATTAALASFNPDINFNYGLLVELRGTNPASTTISFRQY